MEYLLKSILCLLLFLLFYRVFLQQEVLYRFNRFFLLGAVLVSFLIPIITLEVEQEVQAEIFPEAVYPEENLSFVPQQSGEEILSPPIPTSSKSKISWVKIAWGVYFLGVSVFLTRFLRNIRIIRTQIQENSQVSYRGETLVLLRELVAPFSFLKYIFYHKCNFEKEGIPEAIFIHEQCHVREKHSWDILFLEALLIVFWFHPGLHFALQAIRLNHEFIADQEVIQKTPITDYQNLLLSILSGQRRFSLGSNLNFSLTKKRFKMMKRTSKPGIQLMKLVGLVSFLGVIVAVFAEKKVVNKPIEEPVVELNNSEFTQTKTSNLNADDPKERYFREAVFLIESKDMEYTQKSYASLSENEKLGLKFQNQPVGRKSPDAQTFESWKNNQEFALWLDGKVISNDLLETLTPSEISYFAVSKVMDNARSARLPQPFQVGLYSEEGFEESFGPNSKMFKPKTNRDTITITQRNVTWMKDVSRYPDPTTAYLQRNAKYEKLRTSGTIYSQKSREEKALLAKLYQELETEYLRAPENKRKQLVKPIAPDSNRKRFDSSSEGSSEKITSVSNPINRGIEKSYSFVYASGGMPLDEYLARYGEFQTKANENRVFSQPSNEEIENLRKDFDLVQAAYFNLSNEERRKVQRLSFPYAKIENDGVVTYKKWEDLSEEERKTLGC